MLLLHACLQSSTGVQVFKKLSMSQKKMWNKEHDEWTESQSQSRLLFKPTLRKICLFNCIPIMFFMAGLFCDLLHRISNFAAFMSICRLPFIPKKKSLKLVIFSSTMPHLFSSKSSGIICENTPFCVAPADYQNYCGCSHF